MTHPIYHAQSSAKHFGGQAEDYLHIHRYIDRSKELCADARHRFMYHNSDYVKQCARDLGANIINADGVSVSLAQIHKQHCQEDCRGQYPSLVEWLDRIEPQPWMIVGIEELGEASRLQNLAKRFGGLAEDYQSIADWFDAPEHQHGTRMARALTHHSGGIFNCERDLGETLTLSTGKTVPVRYVGEQYVVEGCYLRRIPSLWDWIRHMRIEMWMNRGYHFKSDMEVAA